MYFSFIFSQQFLQYVIYLITINMRMAKTYIADFYIIKKCTKFIFASYKMFYKNRVIIIWNADINIANLTDKY